MPLNETLPDLKSPVPNRRNENPRTRYKSHLPEIHVELLSHPTIEELKDYIPRWCHATWSDKPHNDYSDEERWNCIDDLFNGVLLPSALETINLVFLISNIDLVDVTHLLRHRTMSFSAVCSADRDLRHDDCLIKPSIIFSVAFINRFEQIVHDAKKLYADMVDSDEVSMLDARTILPRCLEHHYYVRVNLKDAIHFIKQRIDRQIQPESDNIVALRMWIEIVKVYPQIKKMIDIDAPDEWYVKTAPTGRSSNIYMPEFPRNDTFQYKKQWFIYKRQRWQTRGGEVFTSLWNFLKKQLEAIC